MAANDELFDSANRHQTFLIRFGGTEANKAVALLNEAEKDLTTKIAERAGKLGRGATAKGSTRMAALLRDIRAQSTDIVNQMDATLRPGLRTLAEHEIDLTDRRLNEAVGFSLNNFRPSPEVLRALVEEKGVRGIALRKWFKRLGDDRFNRLEGAVRVGLLEGDTTPDIVARFRDAERVTKRSAEALVRTHINHVGNAARTEMYRANADIVDKLRWTATLDGRTSPICQARDGRTYGLDEGPRPPAHPYCRSLMTPVLKSWDEMIGPNKLKPGRGGTDIDAVFKKGLAAQGFGPGEIATIRRNTRSALNGQVPDTLTYQTWLARQPAGFVNATLGRTRATLFREGKLRLTRFVDPRTGRELTLEEVKQRNNEKWMKVMGPGEVATIA